MYNNISSLRKVTGCPIPEIEFRNEKQRKFTVYSDCCGCYVLTHRPQSLLQSLFVKYLVVRRFILQ